MISHHCEDEDMEQIDGGDKNCEKEKGLAQSVIKLMAFVSWYAYHHLKHALR
jgi:hypothetical protein